MFASVAPDETGRATLSGRWYVVKGESARPIGELTEVNVKTDDDLRKQVARLLRRRPGWRVQTMPTPGAPLTWCFGTRSGTDLSVSVDRDSISVYVVGADENVTLGDIDQLVGWLRANRAGSLEDPKPGLVDKLKQGSFFKWE
jgi:hypothetical protein